MRGKKGKAAVFSDVLAKKRARSTARKEAAQKLWCGNQKEGGRESFGREGKKKGSTRL